jgi:P27 family predicted phage terminase small subunit
MRTGRPPKSIEERKREGTLRADRYAQTPLLIGGRKKPTCPAYLNANQKKAFKRLVKDLWESGILDKADASLVESAAICWATVVEANKEIEKKGMVIESRRLSKTNPAVTIRNNAQAEFRQLAALLGIGPSSRARLAHMGVKGRELGKGIAGIAELRALQGGKSE